MTTPVLFMIQHLHTGGTEIHVHDLVTGLDRRRFTPHVIYCTPGNISRQLEANGEIPVQRIPVNRAYDLTGLRADLQWTKFVV